MRDFEIVGGNVVDRNIGAFHHINTRHELQPPIIRGVHRFGGQIGVDLRLNLAANTLDFVVNDELRADQNPYFRRIRCSIRFIKNAKAFLRSIENPAVLLAPCANMHL